MEMAEGKTRLQQGMNADAHVCTGRGQVCLHFRGRGRELEAQASQLAVLTCTAAIRVGTPVSRGPLHSSFLTILTAPHGGAEDGGIFSVVERVAISIHWVVEKCEVPREEETGSERAGLGPALCIPVEIREHRVDGESLPFGIMDGNVSTALMEKAFLWNNGWECDSLFPFSSGEMSRSFSQADTP